VCTPLITITLSDKPRVNSFPGSSLFVFLLHTSQKNGEPGRFHHMCNDVLWVVVCAVLNSGSIVHARCLQCYYKVPATCVNCWVLAQQSLTSRSAVYTLQTSRYAGLTPTWSPSVDPVSIYRLKRTSGNTVKAVHFVVIYVCWKVKWSPYTCIAKYSLGFQLHRPKAFTGICNPQHYKTYVQRKSLAGGLICRFGSLGENRQIKFHQY